MKALVKSIYTYKTNKELIRKDRIAKSLESAIEKRRLAIEKNKELNRTIFRKTIINNKKVKNAIIEVAPNDPKKLLDQLINLADIYEDYGQLTKSMIHDVNKDKATLNDILEVLRLSGLIVGDGNRWMRWCDIDYLKAINKNLRCIYNNAINQYIKRKSKYSFLIQNDGNGKLKLLKHPKHEPLTDEEKTAMLANAKEAEHRKRMGIGKEADSEINSILDSAHVEVARMKAERQILIESYKPYFILLLVLIAIIWFINGVNNI